MGKQRNLGVTARRDKRDKKLQSHSGLCSRSIPRDTEIQLPLSIHPVFLSPTRPFPPTGKHFTLLFYFRHRASSSLNKKKKRKRNSSLHIYHPIFPHQSLFNHRFPPQSSASITLTAFSCDKAQWTAVLTKPYTCMTNMGWGRAEVWSRNWLCRLMERAGFRWGDSTENRKTGEEGGCLCTKDSEMTFSCSVYPIKWSRGVQLGSTEAGEMHKSDTCTVLSSAEAWSRHSHWERMFLAEHSLSDASKNPHSSFPLSLRRKDNCIMTFVGHHFTT